jgi:hypothetical protein
MYKLATFEALMGDFVIPPGERHWASITSRHVAEASKALGIIGTWLRLLGVPHTAVADCIELHDLPRGIRVTAASVAGNTGWRSFFDGLDEVAKWPSEGALAVDAAEVIASKRAMTVTHSDARRMITSTAYTDDGVFYELVTGASSANVHVSGPVPTWDATDGFISEEQTRKLEPNERIHAREYESQFSSAWSEGFFGELHLPCVAPWTSRPYDPRYLYTFAIDPAYKFDLFAGCIAHREDNTVVVDKIMALQPPRGAEALSPVACLREVKEWATEYHCGRVFTDQYSSEPLTALAAIEGVTLEAISWTAANKVPSFETVRIMMRDQRIVLPNDKGLLREIAGIGTKINPSGYEAVKAKSGHTDDRICSVVMAATRLASPTGASAWAQALGALNQRGGTAQLGRELGVTLRDLPDYARLRRLVGR